MRRDKLGLEQGHGAEISAKPHTHCTDTCVQAPEQMTGEDSTCPSPRVFSNANENAVLDPEDHLPFLRVRASAPQTCSIVRVCSARKQAAWMSVTYYRLHVRLKALDFRKSLWHDSADLPPA
uniref:Uncharacterized protein n=1 Tax=Knipowitschia caucasica TaxID=637954 RepID=A0AAV2J9T7_KNICA